jgi:hypothetical protein
MGWQYMWWIFPYFMGMWVISWIGPKDLGGLGYLAFFPSMGALAVLALSVFYLAIRESVADKTMRIYMRQFGNKVPPAAP